LNPKEPVQLSQPFLHTAQSQSLLMGTQVLRIESLPIVDNGQADAF